MSFLKEFYSTISQRKIIDYINFLSFIMLGIIITDAYFLLKYYSFYNPAIKVIAIFGLCGLFTGNFLGRFLYSKYKNNRFIHVVFEIIFILFFILYTLRNLFMPGSQEFFIYLFFLFKYSIPVLIFIIHLFFGVKINYNIRISCGDFIDTTQGIKRLMGFLFVGALVGIGIATALYSFNIPVMATIPVAVLLLPSVFLVNLPYSPASYFTSEYEEDKERTAPSGGTGNDIALFNYLNFLCIIIYSYLAFSSISKYYGDLIYVTMIFAVIHLGFILIGFGAGQYIKLTRLYVYGDSFFPVVFLVILIILMSFHGQLSFVAGILLFAPLSLLLGIVLSQSISAVIEQYDTVKRATIFEFSLLILPVPILISLAIINLSNLWFYIIICVVMIVNVVVPAIDIINSDISGYKKGLYFFVSLFFLPLFIFIILFFRISLDSKMYVTRVENFKELQSVNYNADYIRSRATVKMDNEPVFILSDSIIRNHKRALAPITLYHPDEKRILFVDGNQKFFRNPVIGYFRYSLCLDMLSDRDVDYNKLPFSGTQKYVPDNDPFLMYMEKNRTTFFTIVDIPNLLDQTMNSFRFSEEYYDILKKRMERGGVFAQVFNIPGCRPELFAMAVTNLRRSFKAHAVYFFSNIMIIFASDNERALLVNKDGYGRLIALYNSHDDLSMLFMDEPHICSHLMCSRIEDLVPQISKNQFFPARYLIEPDRLRFNKKFLDAYLSNNKKLLGMLDTSADGQAFFQTVATSLTANDAFLSLLKKTELAETRERYGEEISLLFDLKKQAEFKVTLQNYVLKILSYKEKYYYNTAITLEKNKKWEEAQNLYKAVLAINPDNFNANYRMALVCITLQNIEGSFNYLQQAMRINKDHPKVLMQMGILYFSSGKTEEAIEYFNKALQQSEKMPQIYRYLGMCYEKTGNLNEAERNYAKAIAADPNDIDTKKRLDEVRQLIEKDSKKWETPEQKNETDVEQDAEMPLPVSKGAYDVRLKDDDLSLPMIDPVTGEEIKSDKDKAGETNTPPNQPGDTKPPQPTENEPK